MRPWEEGITWPAPASQRARPAHLISSEGRWQRLAGSSRTKGGGAVKCRAGKRVEMGGGEIGGFGEIAIHPAVINAGRLPST